MNSDLSIPTISTSIRSGTWPRADIFHLNQRENRPTELAPPIGQVLSNFHFPHAFALSRTDSYLGWSGPLYQPFAWASVTKLVSSWAILIAVQRGLLSLSDRGGPPGATLRHLLSHCSGVSFDSPIVLVPVGQRRVYSNRGIELAAQMVQSASGYDFARWVEVSVLEPLGMSGTFLPGSPAAGMNGPLVDLVAFGQELLRPRLLNKDIYIEATSVQFPGLGGVLPGYGRQDDNPWGLGPELRGTKSPHWTAPQAPPETFGHFGQSGSFLWVDPLRQACGAFLGEENFGKVHFDNWPQLNAQSLIWIDSHAL